MAFSFTLNQIQYESLVALARKGAEVDGLDRIRQLEEFLTSIEKDNNITRSLVVVKWQELNQPLPPGTLFPETWPPELTATIELVTRPVAKVDVEQMLAQKASNPTNVMCKKDPAGIVGLTPIDDFFLT